MKLKMTVIILAAALLITGCNSGEEAKPKEKAIETDAKVEEKQFSSVYPLSGIGPNEEPEGRAVAVMINNHPDARPQSGLSQADFVYEMLAEAEVTRFLAVYQSEKPEKVGPVRSARDYYIKVAKGLDALFIAHGYSPDAKALLAGGYVDHLNGIEYDGTLFKRADFRKAPHNSYITYKNIEKGAEAKSFELNDQPDPFTFLAEEQQKDLQGNPAPSVMISYGSKVFDVTFQYDEESGKYKRFSGDEQTVEYEKEAPVLLDNVFIIEAPHQVIDNKGRRDINLENGGKGYLLQKGKMNEVQWQNKDGRIVPVKNGVELGLVPGKTWVNVIPDQPGLIESVSVDSE